MRKLSLLGLATLAAIALASAALAKPAAHAIPGAYVGEYTCTQGLTGMTLQLRALGKGRVEALAIYYEHPANRGVESGCFISRGTYDPVSGEVRLEPDRWVFQPGPEWEMTRLEGRIDGERFTGRISALSGPSGCTTFALKRNAKPFKPPPRACVLPAPIA